MNKQTSEEQKRTSQELSKWLKENGCELESDVWWGREKKEDNLKLCFDNNHYDDENYIPIYNAYDILNDICVKYKEQFWGEIQVNDYDDPVKDWPSIKYQYHTHEILSLLQKGKKDAAETHIKKYCLFNPKNK